MKICIVTSSYPQQAFDPAATAGLFVRSFAHELVAQGASVHVLTQDRGLDLAPSEPGTVQLATYPWRGKDRRASYLKPYKPGDMLAIYSLVQQGKNTLRRLQDTHRFDHIFAMWAVPAGYLARHVARQTGVPYSVWCLGSDIWVYGKYPIFRRVVASILRQAQHVYADGYQLGDDARALCGRDVPFLASSRRLDPDLAKPLGLPTDRHHFFFVGRYAKVKGVDVLLDAFAEFLGAGRPAHLHIFGGGPEEEAIRRRAAQPDLAEHVTVGGFADEATVVSYLQACQTSLIPSRNESIPVVLSDALQTGTPVVVTDVGDMGRVVRQLDAGWVVPSESAHELAKALLDAIDTPRQLNPDAISHFDIAGSARRFLRDISPS